ncbi:MAG: hypothetical protein K2J11_00060 [Oscillospiraceae bacterium]|nr:hypothetical protein [Oscillospiraceae bacterium]
MADVGMARRASVFSTSLTLIGLYGIQSILTVGTDNADTVFVPKLL